MIPELESLYRQVIHEKNPTRWLQTDDIIKSYEDSVRFSEEGQVQLLERLTGGDLEKFRRYIDNQAERQDAEGRILFCQGLSIGLRLGSLCMWT